MSRSIVPSADGSSATERSLLAGRPAPCPQGCHRALEHALGTTPEKRDPGLLSKLDAVAGRVLGVRPAGTRPTGGTHA